MLPDIGWAELMMIAVIAIIVVGPKDLPKMLRAIGQWMAKARSMAREFQKGFDEMAREAELSEMREGIEDLKANNPLTQVKKEIQETLDTTKDAVSPKSSVEDYFGGMDPTGASDDELAQAGPGNTIAPNPSGPSQAEAQPKDET